MLRYLSIENFALIDRLEAEFGPGLNLITGETGSGKSIVVDAVNLLLGIRASKELVRQGASAARVEGLFQLAEEHPARALLEEKGIELEGDEVIVRRQLRSTGYHTVFVNDQLSTQAFLQELGGFLADVHGQHDQQELLQSRVHRSFLDTFGSLERPSGKVAALFGELAEVRQRLERLESSERERLMEIDRLQFQLREIESLQLKPGEEEELLLERRLLASAEARLQNARQGYDLVYEKDDSVLVQLDKARRALEELFREDPRLEHWQSRLTEIHYQLEELGLELRDYSAAVQVDPDRLETVQSRLAEIGLAKRKYGSSVEAVLETANRAAQELDILRDSEAEIEGLERRQAELQENFGTACQVLRRARREVAGQLSKAMERKLGELAMPSARFLAQLQPVDQPTGAGSERVEFHLSANPGEQPRPLGRVASGGELSRVILSLKSILTLETYPKTLIFDEIDAGIGGRVASVLGRKLKSLACKHQVFCVTHLPQIAALADWHFFVGKSEGPQRTQVKLERLDEAARVEELARMLAGNQVSQTTRRQARELLSRACGAQARV